MPEPAALPDPFDRERPFSRAEARKAKITLRELLGPQFHKVFFDCYVSSTVPITLELRTGAALGISPADSYASHATAARLWGGVVPDDPDVHVSVPRTDRRSVRRGVKAHVAVAGARTGKHRGIALTTPEQTFLDLAAAGLDLVSLVVLGDSLVKRKRTTPPALVLAAKNWGGGGAKRARRAAAYVRAGVDSPQESRLRMLLVLAGLPEPTVNHVVRYPDGSWKLRFDLSYPWLRLLIEYDGRQHAENTAQWQRDLRRREELDRLGWRIIVVTAADLQDCPAEVLTRVREALAERGMVGLRRRPRTEWMPFFRAA